MVDGKARLMRENFCDGFGDCLPACPTGAITFEEREAPEYDEAAVKKSQMEKERLHMEHHHHGGCPGSRFMSLDRQETESEQSVQMTKPISRLNQWPVQIKVLPLAASLYYTKFLTICKALNSIKSYSKPAALYILCLSMNLMPSLIYAAQ